MGKLSKTKELNLPMVYFEFVMHMEKINIPCEAGIVAQSIYYGRTVVHIDEGIGCADCLIVSEQDLSIVVRVTVGRKLELPTKRKFYE